MMSQKLAPTFSRIIDENSIEVFLSEESSPKLEDIYLSTHLKEQIEISSMQQNNTKIVIKTKKPLDLSQAINYIISINWQEIYAYYSIEVLNKYFDYQGEIGPRYKNGHLSFDLWSPTATEINLHLFDRKDPKKLLWVYPLERKNNGIWNLEVSAKSIEATDLHGYLYALEVTALGETRFALDPYAKSLYAFNPNDNQIEKAVIIDLAKTDPQEFANNHLTNKEIIATPTEFIGYEMHVRDFSIDPELDIPEKQLGTFLGLNKAISHLKDLGVTHAQLMPLQAFYTVDENNRSFQDERISPEKVNYNWGYDTHHYFIPEGWYSTNPRSPDKRITELKMMVHSFHKNGIGVIMDVVYNHLYEHASFPNSAPGCYFRYDEQGNISQATGAGPTLECRNKMVRRLILDSLEYFKNEFHINGFRFDLMSFIDHQTMLEIRKRLDEDIILYGEAWEFTDLPTDIATTKPNLPNEISLGAFNDTCRDSYTGRMNETGFLQGDLEQGPRVRSAIIGAIKNYPMQAFIANNSYDLFAEKPESCINYLAIHDGFTLWDKINLSVGGTPKSKEKLIRMAFAMLMTSQGKIILHGGDEISRSKPLAPNDPNSYRAHTSEIVNAEDGIAFFHENSYKSPDLTNMITWSRKERFQAVYSYLQGLIQLRKAFPSLRYQSDDSIRRGLCFIGEKIPRDLYQHNVKHHPFSDLNRWQIEFKNGPPNKRLFLTGEIHPADGSKNPQKNPYHIDFDSDGSGIIIFNQKQIEQFDTSAWSENRNLKIKLVKTPGSWDYPKGLYSETGNNTLQPIVGEKSHRSSIDLSIIDDTTIKGDFDHNSFVAFSLDNRIESPDAKYKKLFIIHNVANKKLKLSIKELQDFPTHHILVDDRQAGIEPLTSTAVSIKDAEVSVPAKSSTVIAVL